MCDILCHVIWFQVGRWIANRRAKGWTTLSKERQRQLDGIGLIWERPNSWKTRFELVKAYYEGHGDVHILAQYKAGWHLVK